MKLQQALTFAVVGFINSATDLALFAIMISWVTGSVVWANVLSWSGSFIVAYVLNATFTFKTQMTFKAVSVYLVTSLITMAAATTYVWCLAGLTGVWIAKISSVGVSYAVGFFLARSFAFRLNP